MADQVLPVVSVDQVVSWEPCYGETRTRLVLRASCEWNALDFLNLNIPAADRLWAVLRSELLSVEIRKEFAAYVVSQAFAAAEMAVRESAPLALETAGLHAHAVGLRALPPIWDSASAISAARAADATADIVNAEAAASAARAAASAARSAHAAYSAAGRDFVATYSAADSAADAAYDAARAARAARVNSATSPTRAGAAARADQIGFLFTLLSGSSSSPVVPASHP